jgi:hypothetical protein
MATALIYINLVWIKARIFSAWLIARYYQATYADFWLLAPWVSRALSLLIVPWIFFFIILSGSDESHGIA